MLERLKSIWAAACGDLTIQEQRGLRNACRAQSKALAEAAYHRSQLLASLRQMDEGVYLMSMETSWDRMRPHFQPLHEAMMARKAAEPARITSILAPELERTHGQ